MKIPNFKLAFACLALIAGTTAQFAQNQQFGYNNQQNGYNNQQNGYNNQQNGYNNQQNGNNNQQNDDNCCEEYCYTTDQEPYIFFATKTSYDSLNRRSHQQHVVPDCEPIQFWSLNRHGTRLPTASAIERLRNLANKGLHDEIRRNYEERRTFPDRGRFCPGDYDLLRRWRWNDTITEQKAKSLTPQGINEMKLLARRFKAKFPQLLQEPYSPNTYFFQYTDSDRTHDSYQAYIEGLFGSESFKVHANTFSNDKLIKPYKNCPMWDEHLDNNPNRNEYERFVEGQEYGQMARDVFRRLGFKHNLNASVVKDMYDMCRYEKAWNVDQKSAWCAAFTKNHLKILEYAEDLKYYYKTGYGNRMVEKVGCAPVKDMYTRFRDAVDGNSEGTKGTFYFTHSSALQAVLTTMGIAKDYSSPTADNYYQQQRRLWMTSKLSPFAANLAAVLYQCRSQEKYKVMFFLNEVPVEYQDCSVGLCSWSTVKEKFENIVENCNVDDFCNGSSANSIYLSSSLALVFGVLFYFRF